MIGTPLIERHVLETAIVKGKPIYELPKGKVVRVKVNQKEVPIKIVRLGKKRKKNYLEIKPNQKGIIQIHLDREV